MLTEFDGKLTAESIRKWNENGEFFMRGGEAEPALGGPPDQQRPSDLKTKYQSNRNHMRALDSAISTLGFGLDKFITQDDGGVPPARALGEGERRVMKRVESLPGGLRAASAGRTFRSMVARAPVATLTRSWLAIPPSLDSWAFVWRGRATVLGDPRRTRGLGGVCIHETTRKCVF
jgi:hypothetical protein